jgi:hypothetical protein
MAAHLMHGVFEERDSKPTFANFAAERRLLSESKLIVLRTNKW